MKSRLLFTLSLFSGVLLSLNAQYWSATGALPATSGQYLTAACHIGNNIYVVANNQVFGLSTDKGLTWTAPTISAPTGAFASLYTTADRLYANMKINTFDYELHYSLDNGSTWTIDTVGLPNNAVKTGKASMNVYNMGDNYIMAANGTTARYKKLGDPTWKSTSMDVVISDITALNSKWYAIGAVKILQSTDFGVSWSTLTTTGLPANFQGHKLASNKKDKLYISTAPSGGGEDIYFSTDEGASWTLTNSAGHYTHSNPWVGAMHAVGDYIFAAVSPEFANFQDPPPYLMSSASTPNFAPGDTTGLGMGLATTYLPFFFHINDKLYTMMGELYTSTPGFAADLSSASNSMTEMQVYPNPTTDILNISLTEPFEWALSNITGEILLRGKSDGELELSLDQFSSGLFILQTNTTEKSSTTKVLIR